MLNRNAQALKSHHNPAVLSIKNKFYQKEIERFIFQSIISDLYPQGDITSSLLFSKNYLCRADLLCKTDGAIAGLEETGHVIHLFNKQYNTNVHFKAVIKDGYYTKKGELIASLNGDIKSIVALERSILNLIQRMSGIATRTADIKKKLIKINPNILLCATRKTPLGLLDKKAVVIGDGCTHRINLSDLILIKDTHLDYYERDIHKVLEIIYKNINSAKIPIEIEVQNITEAIKATQFFKRHNIIGTIMFDNFSSLKISAVMCLLLKQNLYNSVLFEASGNITEKNIVEYAKTGVDIISLGYLTHSTKAMDISLKLAISD